MSLFFYIILNFPNNVISVTINDMPATIYAITTFPPALMFSLFSTLIVSASILSLRLFNNTSVFEYNLIKDRK